MPPNVARIEHVERAGVKDDVARISAAFDLLGIGS